MKTTNTLTDIQNKESIALEIKHDLENMFTEITGSTPHIINPEGKPFAVFYPKGRDEYIAILNALQPVKDAELKFAGKDPVQTFSPYLVDYGGKHSTPNYSYSNEVPRSLNWYSLTQLGKELFKNYVTKRKLSNKENAKLFAGERIINFSSKKLENC